MTDAKVTRVRVEYEDGSEDELRLIQEGELTIYGLERFDPEGASGGRAAYSGGGMAGLLYITLITGIRTEYSSRDLRVAELARAFRNPQH